MPSQITFKAKLEAVYNAEDLSIAYRRIRVPTLTRTHCDMEWFRRSRTWGGLANSDLFPNALTRIRQTLLPSQYSDHIRLDQLPSNITVTPQKSGLMARIDITIEDSR